MSAVVLFTLAVEGVSGVTVLVSSSEVIMNEVTSI
jgi:hypothetical protein